MSFSTNPEEQEEHVKGLLHEGLFEFLLFSLGCNQYQINTFQLIEDQILRKELKEINSQTVLKLNKSNYISYKTVDNNLLNYNFGDNNVVLKQVNKKSLLEDCWKNVIEFISAMDFNSFSKVCKYFYFILRESNYYKKVKSIYNHFIKNIKLFPYAPFEVLWPDKKLNNEFTKISNFEYNIFKLLTLQQLLILSYDFPKNWIAENNYEIYFKLLQKHTYQNKLINFIPKVFKNDKEFALNIANNHPSLFFHLSEETQKNFSLLTICLDNSIKRPNETINFFYNVTQYIYSFPELFIKLFTKQKCIHYHTPQSLLTNIYLLEGRPIYYKLIEIDSNGVEDYYLHQSPLTDKTICKLLVERNCFKILQHLSSEIINDLDFFSELIVRNIKVLSHIPTYLFKNKKFLLKTLQLLPDILDFEMDSKDDILITKNLEINIDLIVKKLGVTSLLQYQHNFNPIEIMSKYSTRILKFYNCTTKQEQSKLELQAAYIERKRNEMTQLLTNDKNNNAVDKRVIIVSPLSKEIEECLLNNNNLNDHNNNMKLTLQILESNPYLFPYCSDIIKKDKTIQQLVFYSKILTLDEKVNYFKIMKPFIYNNDKTLIEEFLNHCIYIAPFILNNENCDFFIDKFIPLFIKNIIQENGFTKKLKEMLNTIVIPKEWSGNGNLIEKSITMVMDGLLLVTTSLDNCQLKEVKRNLLKMFKITNKEIALKFVKENIEYWNELDDTIKLDLNILNILKKTLIDQSFASKIFTTIIETKKKLQPYLEIIKNLISINPKLINLLPLEFQLNYNILQVIFEKDILNCVKYLPLNILDSFKMVIFDSVKINERKFLLQQFKERYNNEFISNK